MQRESRDPQPAPGPANGAGDGVLAQLMSLARALGGSRYRRRLGLLAGGIVLVVCVNAAAQIRLNRWQGAFYDALEQKHMPAFAYQLLVFAVIVGLLLVLVVGQTWLQEMVKVRLREWLTHELIDQWLAPKRAHLLSFAGQVGVNPDQRIHQDAQHLTELTTVLAVGLLQSSLLLISFVGVLWLLSEQVVFAYGGRSFAIPGYMVWCALTYAAGGSWLAWRAGRQLIPLNAERYAREAELRFALVRTNEHAEGIALYGGEADEHRILDGEIERVVTIMVRLAYGLARLTWVTSGYGWLALVVPILVAAPGYFDGELSFGGLMMVVGAFNQVQQSLRWFVDNFSQIADWRATLLRVAALRDALLAIETLGEDRGRIAVTEQADGNLVLQDLSIALGDGSAALDQPRVEVAPGEHVLIAGDAGAGKSTLFRAIAGLWPCGTGTVQLPPRTSVMFMPERPYLPLGTLRAAVTYPGRPGDFDDAAVRSALERVGLDRLVAELDRENRWDKDLPLDEQERLAFARVLLHRPSWVLLDAAMGSLDAKGRRLMLSLFEKELAGTAVISLGREPASDHFYSRRLKLVRRPGGAPLRLRPRPSPVPAAAGLAS
jgi:vitamin B12/bleomycin/antimicrobial peptide transport system ATP-binding/permease protein